MKISVTRRLTGMAASSAAVMFAPVRQISRPVFVRLRNRCSAPMHSRNRMKETDTNPTLPEPIVLNSVTGDVRYDMCCVAPSV